MNRSAGRILRCFGSSIFSNSNPSKRPLVACKYIEYGRGISRPMHSDNGCMRLASAAAAERWEDNDATPQKSTLEPPAKKNPPSAAALNETDNGKSGRLSGKSAEDGENNEESDRQAKLARVAKSLRVSLPSFFTNPHDYTIYNLNMEFHDRIRKRYCKGVGRYAWELNKMKIIGHLTSTFIRLDVFKITEHQQDMSVRVRWRITRTPGLTGMFLHLRRYLPFARDKSPYMDVDGFSIFKVSPVDGLVYSHVADKMMPDEELDVAAKPSKAEAFKQKLASANI